MAQDWTQTTRVLKAVVVILGIVIVVGLAVLVAEVARRIFVAAEAPAPPRGFAEAVVALPAGARARAMTGSAERVTLLIEHADGGQELLTIDLATGEVVGRIALGAGQNPVGRQ